ncbi:stage V sporulation protein K [Anoxybacter fermentans]|uniref:Stage V sporulation protein K n=2 Tax=Anoxybacter fermentans TaxID=1323375 RepID=A0A3S9T2Q8_9FIRM|nr:stage V sporulation protein K [Anoxybacter fermentans]
MTNEILHRLENGEITITKAFNLLNQTTVLDYTTKIYDNNENPNQLEELLAELDGLIGLKKVKKLIHEYRAFIEIQKRRQHVGLKTEPLVMHMIFKGNPGTGKTTVARILSKILKELGVLEKGHMIEAERADLVGEYIGHTAQKTRKMIQKALGGVLFIDEAYSLARGGERDFGKEAIDTMVKALEDYKNSLVIILAGYPKEMDEFLITNPGLKSRFPLQLNFEDYTLKELIAIGEKLALDRDYKFTLEAKTYLYQLLLTLQAKGELESGNARTVRNIIERAIRSQAVRLLNQEEYRREELMYLKREDLEKGVEECQDV